MEGVVCSPMPKDMVSVQKNVDIMNAGDAPPISEIVILTDQPAQFNRSSFDRNEGESKTYNEAMEDESFGHMLGLCPSTDYDKGFEDHDNVEIRHRKPGRRSSMSSMPSLRQRGTLSHLSHSSNKGGTLGVSANDRSGVKEMERVVRRRRVRRASLVSMPSLSERPISRTCPPSRGVSRSDSRFSHCSGGGHSMNARSPRHFLEPRDEGSDCKKRKTGDITRGDDGTGGAVSTTKSVDAPPVFPTREELGYERDEIGSSNVNQDNDSRVGSKRSFRSRRGSTGQSRTNQSLEDMVQWLKRTEVEQGDVGEAGMEQSERERARSSKAADMESMRRIRMRRRSSMPSLQEMAVAPSVQRVLPVQRSERQLLKRQPRPSLKGSRLLSMPNLGVNGRSSSMRGVRRRSSMGESIDNSYSRHDHLPDHRRLRHLPDVSSRGESSACSTLNNTYADEGDSLANSSIPSSSRLTFSSVTEHAMAPVRPRRLSMSSMGNSIASGSVSRACPRTRGVQASNGFRGSRRLSNSSCVRG